MDDRFGSYSWFKFGSKRRVVVMAMTEEDMFPAEISRNTRQYGKRITLCNLSGTLKELISAGILRCTDTSVVRGRPYSLTPKGKGFQERLRASISAAEYFRKHDEQHF